MDEVAKSDVVAGGIEPTAFDVLMGVPASYVHAGNQAFRALISEYLERYESAVHVGKKHGKMEVASSVLRVILEGGGRFLKRDPPNRWYQVKNSDARRKIINALYGRSRLNSPCRYGIQRRLCGDEGDKQEQSTASHQETQATQQIWRKLVLQALPRSTETPSLAGISYYLQNRELLDSVRPPVIAREAQTTSTDLDKKQQQTSQGSLEAKLPNAGTSPGPWAGGGRSTVASPKSTNDPWSPPHVTWKQIHQDQNTVLHPDVGLANRALSDSALYEKLHPVEWSTHFSTSTVANTALDAPIDVNQQPLESTKKLHHGELRRAASLPVVTRHALFETREQALQNPFNEQARHGSNDTRQTFKVNLETLLPGMIENDTRDPLCDPCVPNYSSEHKSFSGGEMLDQFFEDLPSIAGDENDVSDSELERLLDRMIKEGRS